MLQPVITTRYAFHTNKLTKPVKLAVISDLHNEPYQHLFPLIEGADALLVPGDISNRYRQRYDNGLAFLKEAAQRLPVFYSLGNHEARQQNYRALRSALEDTGAAILINRHVRFGELVIGGWYDPTIVSEPEAIDAMEAEDGCKVLLCHKPELYMKHLQHRDIDLAVAGHAHGGQIRLGQQGVYAPGQGLFPRYTRGLVGEKLIVSAGVGNPAHMPRWGNPREVVLIDLD